jgi:hypothetical protein
MNLGKYIFGIRKSYFEKTDQKVQERQIKVYNYLALMFYTLVAVSIVAGGIYGLVLFNSWIYALVIGLFLGFISFILLLLVLFLNMTTNYQDLYVKMTNMKPILEKYYTQNLEHLSDEEAHKIVTEQKMLLRESSQEAQQDPFRLSNIITSAIKVSLILILSCVVANAMEFAMFHGKLNETLNQIKNDERIQACASLEINEENSELQNKQIIAKWTLDMLKEKPNEPFILIDSQSVLLSMQILDLCLGKFKILLDVLFALLFLTPFILVKKSKEYAGGVFLKEAALVDISSSFMFFLLAQRERQRIKRKIETEFDYNTLFKPHAK